MSLKTRLPLMRIVQKKENHNSHLVDLLLESRVVLLQGQSVGEAAELALPGEAEPAALLVGRVLVLIVADLEVGHDLVLRHAALHQEVHLLCKGNTNVKSPKFGQRQFS